LTKQNDCGIITSSNKGGNNVRAKINLDTLSRINKFVSICSRLDCNVDLIDGRNYRVSAKSLIGAMATTDWTEVFVECERDIYGYIYEFIAE
jgi:hypothetical protein